MVVRFFGWCILIVVKVPLKDPIRWDPDPLPLGEKVGEHAYSDSKRALMLWTRTVGWGG